MSRSFTVDAVYYKGHILNYNGGRFISENSASAARKAFSQIYREYKRKGRAHPSYVIHMRETTQGSHHKIRKYKVQRVADKTQVERDGVLITYKYKTVVKALK